LPDTLGPPVHDDHPPVRLHADTGSTDLEAYRARARAAGRDPVLLAGTEGLNVAADGGAYVGPLDNESSRALAAGRVLTVDPWECISCGTCVEHTDAVFALPPDGKATPLRQDGPMDLVQDAIDACPVTCIAWVERTVALERGLHTGPLDP
jgi:ferredoxin